MYKCKICELELDSTKFYWNKATGKRNPRCKSCISIKQKLRYIEEPSFKEKRIQRYRKYIEQDGLREKNRERGAAFYRSLRGRAMTLLKSTQRRSVNYAEKNDLDLEYILNKLEKGVCEATGIVFDFDRPKSTIKNPYSPSVDRIDSSKGYTRENTQIVIWQYNLMKGELTEQELLELCHKVIERKKIDR